MFLDLNNELKECLIDTGAKTSFISYDYFNSRNFKLAKIIKRRNWITANGSPLKVDGQTTISIKIGSKIIEATFIISRQLSHDVIVGMDILKPNKFVIDLDKNELVCGEEKVEITTEKFEVPELICAVKQIEIEPLSTTTYKIKNKFYDPNKTMLIEKIGKYDVIETIASIDNNEITICLQNLTPAKQIIRKHSMLCKISSCAIIETIDSEDKLRNFINKDSKFEYVNNISTTRMNTSKPWKPSRDVKIYNSKLTNEQKGKLRDLIDKYWMCFSRNDEDIGTVADKFGEHDIQLTEEKPIKQRPYNTPHAKEKIVDESVDKMLKMGIIEPSNSEWASPIVLVKKPDGSERFCVDYRKVNEVTIKDSFPMPNIESKLNKLHGSTIFTSLDCTSGYWQIKLSEKAKQISSFISNRGLFSFKVMPFGLCNAGATFQRIMELVLSDLRNSTAYIDDILTFSEDFDKHLEHLEKLLIRLKDANLKVKTSKCKIASEQTMFLGYKISAQGVSIDETRSKAIMNYPRPKTQKQVKQFLGLASYYRQFVPNFSDIVDPLNILTRKNVRFKWSEECQKAFDELIKLLSNTPILAFPDFSKKFHLTTDASNLGIGAVLSQIDDMGRENVIFYASRSLNKAERNYSTIEREFLGIVYAVEKFRYYLYGTEFIIHTDHNPLTYLNNLTLSSARLTRWRLKLAEYNFKIVYKKGSMNKVADPLSRNFSDETNESSKEDLIETLLSIVSEREKQIDDKIIYHDSDITEVVDKPIVVCISKYFRVQDGILKKLIEKFKGLTPLNKQKLRVGECYTRKNTDASQIVFLISKYHSKDKPSYENFERCIKSLARECKQSGLRELAFPKMMVGLDKLSWSRVSKLLNKTLIDQGITCHVYTNTSQLNAVREVDDLNIDSQISKLQRRDEQLIGLRKLVENGKLKGFTIENNVLLKVRRNRRGRRLKQLVVPQELRSDILRLCHDEITGAHLGQKKTWVKLNNRFYWPNSYKETINYVESCETCAKFKDAPINRANLKPITEFEKPFDMIAVDILELSRTNNGNKYVVVFTDYLTKWVEAFAIRDTKAETIARIFVNEIITRHSAPSKLLSDQGRNFLSSLIKSICDYFKINKIQTAPYNPQCDGLVERFNKTLCKMLSAYSDSNQTNWDLYLPLVLFAYRTSEQSTSGFSPFSLLYGREPRLGDLDNYNLGYEPGKFINDLHNNWLLAKHKIVKQAEKNKKLYDAKYKKSPPKYEVNEKVRIHKPQTKVGLKKKLRNDLWSEPVKISKVISDQNIEVEWNNKKKIVNVNNVKKKEPDRNNQEVIREDITLTRSGRISKPRYNNKFR